MKHNLYHSIDDMTKPETLSELVGQTIDKTCLIPIEPSGWSSTDSSFLSVDDCRVAKPRYILKRMRRNYDWVMQATSDHNWRAISVWQYGLLDLLPEKIDHGIIGCTVDNDGYAILMRNVADTLLRDDIPISVDEHKFILESMATFHATFWQNGELQNAKYNLCKPEDFFSHTSPSKARKMRKNIPSIVLEFIIDGHRQLPNFVETSLAEILHNLVLDPTLICQKISCFPHTLIHSDIRRANLGIERGGRPNLVILDWTRPTVTVPGVDLVYYLFTNFLAHMPISIQDSIEFYRRHLARRLGDRFSENWWKPQLELSILGIFAMMGCFNAYFAVNAESKDERRHHRENLEFWSGRAIKGVELLMQ